MLSFILLFCFVGCDDEDYSSDIDALKKELEETKAAVKTIQDSSNALQNQLFINFYEKTEDGYTLKMSDGSIISVTQGQKGDDGTDAPTITDIKETENALEFMFSDGSIITLPKEEKYDVITIDCEVSAGDNTRVDFQLGYDEFWGNDPVFPFPEDLEINWGDGRTTGSSEYRYKTSGTYTITIKGKKIYSLNLNELSCKIKNIDISQCSNLKGINIDLCEGNITLENAKELTFIEGRLNTTILNLNNLSKLKCLKLESSTLNELNITNCPNIEILEIENTNLNSIDITNYKNLYKLDCSNSSISTIWVWDGFDPSTFDEWRVPEGVECKIKQ